MRRSYERMGKESMTLKEALTQMKQRSAEMAVKAQASLLLGVSLPVCGCCCCCCVLFQGGQVPANCGWKLRGGRGRDCSRDGGVGRAFIPSAARSTINPLRGPPPHTRLPQKQADEAAVQRQEADAVFQDVSGQLQAERDRIPALEVRNLMLVHACVVCTVCCFSFC